MQTWEVYSSCKGDKKKNKTGACKCVSSESMWFYLALGRVAAQSGSLTATTVSDTWKPAHKSLPRELKEQDAVCWW